MLIWLLSALSIVIVIVIVYSVLYNWNRQLYILDTNLNYFGGFILDLRLTLALEYYTIHE